MRTVATLCMLLLASPAWAGTLRDDFNDGNFDGWRQTWMNQNQTSWKVESGVLTGNNVSEWGAYLIIGDTIWEDYEVECDSRIVSFRSNLATSGISLRHNAQTGAALKTMALGLVMFDNNFGVAGAWATYLANDWPVPKRIEPMPVELGKWYHLKASIHGDKYELELDGSLIISMQDNALTSGAIGLEAHAGIAEYDNVIIRGDDVPDLNLAVNPNGKLTTNWGEIRRGR